MIPKGEDRDENKLCTAKKSDGSPCMGYRGENSVFCFFHDPDRKEEAQAVRVRSGLETKPTLGKRAKGIEPPKSTEDWARFLGVIANRLVVGEITNKTAEAVANIARAAKQFVEKLESREVVHDSDSLKQMSDEELDQLAEQYMGGKHAN